MLQNNTSQFNFSVTRGTLRKTDYAKGRLCSVWRRPPDLKHYNTFILCLSSYQWASESHFLRRRKLLCHRQGLLSLKMSHPLQCIHCGYSNCTPELHFKIKWAEVIEGLRWAAEDEVFLFELTLQTWCRHGETSRCFLLMVEKTYH